MTETPNKFKVEKFTGYSIILWERGIKELTGNDRFFNYTFNTMTEMLFYFYCTLYASKKIEITFDEFIIELDEYPSALTDFMQDYNKYIELQAQFMSKETDKKKLKKARN